jgi:hypothetical protein
MFQIGSRGLLRKGTAEGLEVRIEAPAGRTLPPGCLRQRPSSEREVQVTGKFKGKSWVLNLVLNLPLTLQLASLLEGGGTEGDGGSCNTAPPSHPRATTTRFCSSRAPVPSRLPLD